MKKKRNYKSVKQIRNIRDAKARIKKINAFADIEQKKSGTKTKTVKTYKLDRKTALKRAGKKYKKIK